MYLMTPRVVKSSAHNFVEFFGPNQRSLSLRLDLFSQSHFVLLQELGLFQSNFNKLNQIEENLDYVACSAMDECAPLIGRRHGGCAILWKQNLSYKIEKICMKSTRICAILIHFDDFVNCALFTAYMPCDEGNRNINAYGDVLNDIDTCIENYKPTYCIIAGDFNVDFRRVSPQTNVLKSFMSRENYKCRSCDVPNCLSYTFSSANGESFSVIDHVLLCDNLYGYVSEYKTYDSVDNFSDHVAVVCCLNIPLSLLHRSLKQSVNKYAWNTATATDIDNYRTELDKKLDKIIIPECLSHCENYNCLHHENLIECLYNSITTACEKASAVTIPKCGSSGKAKRIPGWTEHVAPYKQKALFWHQLWKDNGSPRNGQVAEIRRQTRAKYHAAVRKVKREKNIIKSARLAEAMADGNGRDFWGEIRKVGGCNTTLPNSIDNIAGDQDIADLFANKFSQLYTSVPYDKGSMCDLKRQIRSDIINKCEKGKCNNHCSAVSVYDVIQAVKRMKHGKSDSTRIFCTDNIIHGSHKLYVLLSILFTCMMRHGLAPVEMQLGTMIPIPKINGTNKSDNYRAITLGSIVGKLLDIIILLNHKEELNNSYLQFGFKKGSSTTSCTFAVQEVIAHYINNNSDVYCVLLDASKAFDRVEFCALFTKLMSRKICPLVIRLLLYMYTTQILTVRWNASYSELFNVTNGVKQGGVISPILYCVYTDDLLNNLKKSGVGCCIGSYFYGALSYADDIILINPTVSGTKKMLNICELYAEEHKIMFNGTKSKLVVFTKKNKSAKVRFVMNGEVIPEVNNAKYLGHVLGNNISGYVSNGTIIQAFNKQVNILMAKFGNVASSILCKLFTFYCCSLYGLVLCKLSTMENVFVQWRKAMRRICRLPYRTHNRLIPHFLHSAPIDILMTKRIMKFYMSLIHSENVCIKALARRCMYQSTSNMGSNIIHISRQLGKTVSLFNVTTSVNVVGSTIVENWEKKCNNKEKCVSNVCIELMDIRDGLMHSELTINEACDLLSLLCTE